MSAFLVDEDLPVSLARALRAGKGARRSTCADYVYDCGDCCSCLGYRATLSWFPTVDAPFGDGVALLFGIVETL